MIMRMRSATFLTLVALACLTAGGIVACGPQNVGQFRTGSRPQVTGTGVSGTTGAASAGGTVNTGLSISVYVTPSGGADDLASSVGPVEVSFDIVDGNVSIYVSTTPTATQPSQASNYSGDTAYTVETQCVATDCSTFAAYIIGNSMTTSNEVLIAALFQNQGGSAGVVKLNEIDNTPFSDMTSVINALEGNNGVPL